MHQGLGFCQAGESGILTGSRPVFDPGRPESSGLATENPFTVGGRDLLWRHAACPN